MSESPRELARADGVLGEVVLRERPGPAGPVYELIVNGVFLMDTAEASTERLLAEAVLARHRAPARVLVGGLGLGITLGELLADVRVREVRVVEVEPRLVEWLRADVVPGAAHLLDDPRVRVDVADIGRLLAARVDEPYDAFLLDVDNGPGFLVHARNAPLYRPAGLAAAARALRPGGVLAVWSADEAPQLHAALRDTVGPTDLVHRRVERQGRELDYYLYVARDRRWTPQRRRLAGMHLTHLDCPRCGAQHDAGRPQGRCGCGSPLLARYDLAAVGRVLEPARLPGRAADLWRYRELLPVADPGHVSTLGEGWTPLLSAPRYGAAVGVPRLRVKDEGLVPTGSFKARGAAVGVSRAAELGVRHVAMPTNGNAGAAWATYAARAGIRATIAMPTSAPMITRQECVAAGAELHLVDGLINDAGRMVAELIAIGGGEIFDASTLQEPYRLEGKKTMGYELVEQLGWRIPDVIVYPTGGGVGLIGIHKALSELRTLGWIGVRQPRLVAVQSTSCAPIVRAFETGAGRAEPWPDAAASVAFGVTVPAPLGDELMLDALRDTGGTAVAVDDEQLLADLREFGAAEGLLLCPEGAACLTAVRRLRDSGGIGADEEVVVLNTGAGLKYPDTVPAI